MFRRVVILMFVAMLVSQIVWASPAAIARQATPVAPDDFTVDAGDRTLQVACRGTGGPPVIQEIGGPDPAGGVVYLHESGDFISGLLGVRFCGYDRAGTGSSPADPVGVRTLSAAGADLLAVLASPDTGCPCVVLAESLGGGIALAALAQDPSNVAGLVSLDALTPGYAEAVLELAPPGSAEAGLTSFFEGQNDEMIDYRMTAGMVPATAPGIPISVLTHGAGDPPPCPCSEGFPVDQLEIDWQHRQDDLAERLGVEVIVAENAGHIIAADDPDLVVATLLDVIAEANA
jgi:pimeloyl-ACP methyl ester carboxylesterase